MYLKIITKLKILKIILQITISFPVTVLDLAWIKGNLLSIGTGNQIFKNIFLNLV